MAKSKEPRTKGQTLGASYRAASTGILLASPAIHVAGRTGPGGGGVPIGRDIARDVWNQYKADSKGLALGVATHAADNLLGQRVFQHNAALGRNSLTAWASEIIAVAPGVYDAQATGSVTNGLTTYAEAKTGFKAGAGWRIADTTKAYLAAKYGLGAARKLSNMGLFRSLAIPVKRGLGAMGASL